MHGVHDGVHDLEAEASLPCLREDCVQKLLRLQGDAGVRSRQAEQSLLQLLQDHHEGTGGGEGDEESEQGGETEEASGVRRFRDQRLLELQRGNLEGMVEKVVQFRQRFHASYLSSEEGKGVWVVGAVSRKAGVSGRNLSDLK